jgi:hypothetical protein
MNDPHGLKAIQKVDFRQLGIFFPEKDYTSVQEAHQTLL